MIQSRATIMLWTLQYKTRVRKLGLRQKIATISRKSENPPKKVFKTLPLPSKVIAKLLDFQTNDFSGNIAPFIPYNPTTGVESGQKRDGSSSSSTGHIYIPPVSISETINANNIPRDPRGLPSPRVRSFSDPRLKKRDIPKSIVDNILHYDSLTLEDKSRGAVHKDKFDYLPHSPNSYFESRTQSQREQYIKEKQQLAETEAAKKKEESFILPRKFSANFTKRIREKLKKTLTITKNSFQVLTDESDSEHDDEIGKIVKKRKKGQKFVPLLMDDKQNNIPPKTLSNDATKTPNNNENNATAGRSNSLRP